MTATSEASPPPVIKQPSLRDDIRLLAAHLGTISEGIRHITNPPPRTIPAAVPYSQPSPEWIREMREKAIGLEGELGKDILGQEEASRLVADAVIRSEWGLANPRKPRACFLFVGSTGVGKTEITLSLTRNLYGSDDDYTAGGCIARFDMSEYGEDKDVSRLIGRHRDEQGLLGDAIDALNSRGGGILLFDEIEKAAPTVKRLFLGLMDAGRITMSNGSQKDATRFYIVFTSNLGAARAMGMVKSSYSQIQRALFEAVRKDMSPELANRFSEIIAFKPLGDEVQLQVCDMNIRRVKDRMVKTTGISRMEVDMEVRNRIVGEGFNRKYGARPMQRVTEREIGNAVARLLVRLHRGGVTKPPSRVVLTVDHDHDEQPVIGLLEEEAREMADRGHVFDLMTI